MREEEYKITFTADYQKYEKYAESGDEYWKDKVANNPDQLALCKKYSGKSVKLAEIPALIREVGQVVLSEGEVEIYNDYRE